MKIIDISEHNGYIDFKKVKQDGIEGVIIRVGWLGNRENHTIDKYFEDYYLRAIEENLKIGFYVYSYCKSFGTLVSGTNWFIDKVKNKKCDIGCFLDLEDYTISNLSTNDLTMQAVQFCTMVEKQGKKAGVYASEHWFKTKLDISKLLTYKIWLAKWTNNEPKENFRYDLWQYSDKGEVNGINGYVDLNKCMNCKSNEKEMTGDDEEVKSYVNGTTVEPIYADTNLTKKIGFLNPHEVCECLGIFKNRAIVRYKVDGNLNNNYKIGFAGWLGGVK